jgi:fermentation-respiration switch protein FrsA (DUF1100 family)
MGTYSPLFSVEQAMLYPGLPDTSPAQPSDVFFTTDDGVRLHGRYFESPESRAVILYCHGNAGNVETWSATARELQERHRCSVFLFDYRGYGKSSGTSSEEGLRCDARAARRWLATRASVTEKEIVLLGRSLGGGVAVDLASRDGCRGLILQNTFSSLPDVAAWHAPWLLPRWLMTQQFCSVEKIRQYPGPLLQCHGDADTLIPLELSKRLHAAAPGPKRFVVQHGGGHNDPPSEEYQRALGEFLQSLDR